MKKQGTQVEKEIEVETDLKKEETQVEETEKETDLKTEEVKKEIEVETDLKKEETQVEETEKANEIIATEISSPLTGDEIDFLLKEKIKWHIVKLRSWDNVNVGDFCNFEEGENIIVIDVTNKPWVKQLGSIGRDESRIIGVSNIIKRHLSHCRCMTPIGLKDNSTYCEKCRQKVPSKSLCFKSNITNKILKTKNIIIGEAFITNSKPIILIDLEYTRRHGNIL